MPRPRTNPLPTGVYHRRDRNPQYWIAYPCPLRGKRVQEAGGDTIAAAVAKRRQRLEAGARNPDEPAPDWTLEAFATWWLARRVTRTRSGDEALWRLHVQPYLGRVAVGELRPRAVIAWLAKLTGAGRGAKVVRNAHAVLSAMLKHAVVHECAVLNAARDLPEGSLPHYEPARKGRFERHEIEKLLTHEEIPEPYRIAFAIAAFTGARLGEVAGLRWSDLEDAEPLRRWDLRVQYADRRPLKSKRGNRPRLVPIHRELWRLLARWKLTGYREAYGTSPQPGDLVAPRRRADDFRELVGHTRRSLGSALVRWAPRVGVELGERDFHSFRRAFVTWALEGQVERKEIRIVTHGDPREDILDVYRYARWATLCAVVDPIELTLPREGAVVPIRKAGA